MKFKVIFYIFNGIILFSFLMIFLMPIILLGADTGANFWTENWYFAAFFLLLLIILDSYFISNWKLFTLMEKEDWPGLSAFLEEKIEKNKKVKDNWVPVLINAYVVSGEIASIKRLEAKIREYSPVLLAPHGMNLGIPHLISNDPKAMLDYFGEIKELSGKKPDPWITWSLAFASSLEKDLIQSKSLLEEILAQKAGFPMVTLLAAYLYDSSSIGSDLVTVFKKDFQAKYNKEKWEKEFQKQARNLPVLILSKIISDAAKWALESPVSDEKAPPDDLVN